MKLVYVVSEVHPFSKTGGLADVASALPKALAKNIPITVISPWYDHLNGQPTPIGSVFIPTLGETAHFGRIELDGVEYIFLHLNCFSREHFYGYADDVERFSKFCVSLPYVLAALNIEADIIHLNDWQTGLIAPIIKLMPLPANLPRSKIVFTIHNLQYQGRWNLWEVLSWTGLPASVVQPTGLEFWGDASCLKAGISYADVVTTVSPTYALEIQTPEHGFGLDGSLRHRGVIGILNGLDTDYWNPATDQYLKHPYNDLASKQQSRKDLCDEFGLETDRPLLAMVTRLVLQKGLDLVAATLPSIAKNWNLVVLGAGEAVYEGALAGLAILAPNRVGFRQGLDEALAHRIYAGADALLMPSRFEPCGLSQLIAMRYGTVPIARRTGGLADSVDETCGYCFNAHTSLALAAAIERAASEWKSENWKKRVEIGMKKELSWEKSMKEHLELYKNLI